mgnify:CR=1 FL=1
MLYINTLYIKIHLSLKIRLILFAGLEKSCTFAPTKHRGVEQLVAPVTYTHLTLPTT